MVKRSKVSMLDGDHTAQAVIDVVALGDDNEQIVWKNNTGQSVKITEAAFQGDAAHSGADTNNMILQFRNKGVLGTGTTGITATKEYDSGTDLVAFLSDALVLSTTAADLIIDDGETVALNKTESGTGLASPKGIATLTYEFV